jgi:phage tail-like protein
MARLDPLRNFRFRLEIDGSPIAGFSEVEIGETMVEAIDYREGTDPPHVRKLSGLTKFGNIVLKRGLVAGAQGLDLFKWWSDISTGQLVSQRKNIAIIVQDEAGADQARFVVSAAWPIKYQASDLNGKGNEVIIEVLELVNEGIERVK